ncbi:hypothetical protein HZI73_07810 [Vallitalea pronyensis]|uniref:Uncharacterized protein n=1 Tax=Vallitalea pronyensis TaxID=1348613 RepID=A0A8J8MID7_9FIRM|nr:hypothetical protein [Vallitalea pronyensis]QUI22205.1 hypothetical protein HZI73_07810 [Vallitalea pronyensis]
MNLEMKAMIDSKIIPHIERLMTDILQHKDDLTMAGIKVFKSGDVFVPGKIINGASFVLVMMDEGEKKEAYLHAVRKLIHFTAHKDMKTWGHFNYLKGLYRLKEHDLLHQVLEADALDPLKEKLDWREFVKQSDYSLVNYPTNYYGVAYGIAKYRELLGWDFTNHSDILLDKFIHHVTTYSGEHLYMDETPGEGRYDRYSILIPGEICGLLYATGVKIPEVLLNMLRQSLNICLSLVHEKGHGIGYGRSIGPYGDTAILEVLSIGAVLGLLNETEKEIAYGYHVRIIHKFVDFWMDDAMQSINMWEKGRGTDGYRHKGRILGENMSLCCQVLHTYHDWVSIGYGNRTVSKNWKKMIDGLTPYNYYAFTEDQFDRGLLVVRDKSHVFQLPLINGGGGTAGDVRGNSYYYATPYLPIPNEALVLESPADTFYAQLMPRYTFEDGSELMSLAYMKDITTYQADDYFELTYILENLCQVGDRYPIMDQRGACRIKYVFKSGYIKREEWVTWQESSWIEIVMEFLCFSNNPTLDEHGFILFEDGPIQKFKVSGLDYTGSEVLGLEEVYHTSHKALETKLQFRKQVKNFDRPMKIQWEMFYDNRRS